MKKAYRIALALLTGLPAFAFAQISPSIPGQTSTYSGNLINQTGLASTMTATIDMAKYQGSRVSAQIVYSSYAAGAMTFNDGQESTGTVTIISTAPLVGAKATNRITVGSATGIYAAQLNVNGTTFSNFNTPTTTGTAAAITTLLNTVSGIAAARGVGVGTTSIVYTTATAVGVAGNNVFLISNTSSITVTSLKYTGGQDNAVLTVNGTALIQGTQWSATNSGVHITAQNLAAAVTTQFTVLTATVPGNGGAINITSTINNANYAVTSSTPAAMSAPAPGALSGGSAASTTIGSQTIAITAHRFTTPLSVLLTTAAAISTALPTPLLDQTTYYVIALNPNQIALATTSARALLGLGAVITSSSAQATADLFTLSPLIFTKTSTMTWQTSNDGTNWVSSATFTSTTATGATDNLYDFGFLNMRYLRLDVKPPDTGAINLTVPVYIKQDGIGPF